MSQIESNSNLYEPCFTDAQHVDTAQSAQVNLASVVNSTEHTNLGVAAATVTLLDLTENNALLTDFLADSVPDTVTDADCMPVINKIIEEIDPDELINSELPDAIEASDKDQSHQGAILSSSSGMLADSEEVANSQTSLSSVYHEVLADLNADDILAVVSADEEFSEAAPMVLDDVAASRFTESSVEKVSDIQIFPSRSPSAVISTTASALEYSIEKKRAQQDLADVIDTDRFAPCSKSPLPLNDDGIRQVDTQSGQEVVTAFSLVTDGNSTRMTDTDINCSEIVVDEHGSSALMQHSDEAESVIDLLSEENDSSFKSGNDSEAAVPDGMKEAVFDEDSGNIHAIDSPDKTELDEVDLEVSPVTLARDDPTISGSPSHTCELSDSLKHSDNSEAAVSDRVKEAVADEDSGNNRASDFPDETELDEADIEVSSVTDDREDTGSTSHSCEPSDSLKPRSVREAEVPDSVKEVLSDEDIGNIHASNSPDKTELDEMDLEVLSVTAARDDPTVSGSPSHICEPSDLLKPSGDGEAAVSDCVKEALSDDECYVIETSNATDNMEVDEANLELLPVTDDREYTAESGSISPTSESVKHVEHCADESTVESIKFSASTGELLTAATDVHDAADPCDPLAESDQPLQLSCEEIPTDTAIETDDVEVVRADRRDMNRDANSSPCCEMELISSDSPKEDEALSSRSEKTSEPAILSSAEILISGDSSTVTNRVQPIVDPCSHKEIDTPSSIIVLKNSSTTTRLSAALSSGCEETSVPVNLMSSDVVVSSSSSTFTHHVTEPVEPSSHKETESSSSTIILKNTPASTQPSISTVCGSSSPFLYSYLQQTMSSASSVTSSSVITSLPQSMMAAVTEPKPTGIVYRPAAELARNIGKNLVTEFVFREIVANQEKWTSASDAEKVQINVK